MLRISVSVVKTTLKIYKWSLCIALQGIQRVSSVNIIYVKQEARRGVATAEHTGGMR